MTEDKLYQMWIDEGRDPLMFPRLVELSEEDIEWAKRELERHTDKKLEASRATFSLACPECGVLNTVIVRVNDKKGWECTDCRKSWETAFDGTTVRHALALSGAVRTVDTYLEEWPTELI